MVGFPKSSNVSKTHQQKLGLNLVDVLENALYVLAFVITVYAKQDIFFVTGVNWFLVYLFFIAIPTSFFNSNFLLYFLPVYFYRIVTVVSYTKYGIHSQ